MKLFTPLSATDADQAERGMLRGDFFWVDRPRAEAAEEGAVWVSIEVPDNRMSRFERRQDRRSDQRTFLLPARITNLHQARRVQPPR